MKPHVLGEFRLLEGNSAFRNSPLATTLLVCAALAFSAPAHALGSFGIELSSTNAHIQWSDTGAELQSAPSAAGPWTGISNATSPYLVVPGTLRVFFRLRATPIESLYVAPQFTDSIGNPVFFCGCTSPENPNAPDPSGSANSNPQGTCRRPPGDPPKGGPPGAGAPQTGPPPVRPQDSGSGNVLLQTGELVQAAVDLVIPGRGFDWQFERHYRSGMQFNGPLGPGWDFTQDRRLVVQADGNVMRVDGAGRADLYVLLPGGSYQSPSGFYTQLTRISEGGSYIERDQHGLEMYYAAADSFGVARLTEITDRNGNTMNFIYNTAGQLTNVTDTLGRTITYQYNSNGSLAQVEDFTGRTVKFGYDVNGDLISETSPAVTGTPNTNNFPSGKTTLYSYNGLHQLQTMTAPNESAGSGPARLVAQYDSESGRLRSLFLGGTNAAGISAGGTLTYSYTNLSEAEPGDVTTAVFQTTVVNRDGNTTQYQFNQLGNVLDRVQFTRGLREGDPPAYTNIWTYNGDGQTTAHTDPELDFYQFTFDSTNHDRFQQGNLLETVIIPGPRGGDQSGLFIHYSYETNFNFLSNNVDARGNVTSYTYDTRGNCLHITYRIPSIVEDFTYNTYGQTISHLLPDNGSGYRRLDTVSYYDAGPQTGYPQNIVVDSGGLNLTNHLDPDPVGNVTNTVDARGNNAVFVYNSLNQVVRTLSRAVSTESGLVRYQTDIYYDADNNITNVSILNFDGTGSLVDILPTISTSFAFDILGDITGQTRWVNSTHAITTTNHYDADQNQDVAASGEAVNGDQPNNIVQTIYDERDLPFQRIRAPGNPAQSTTQYDFDLNGKPSEVIQGIEDTAAPRITLYAFDGFNRLETITDAMGNITTRHFDANGNRVSEQVNGELVDVPGTNSNVRLSLTTGGYDAMDRKTNSTMAFFNETNQAAIGSGSAVTTTIYNGISQVTTNIDANSNATVMTYDTAARLSMVTDAGSNTVQYAYDPNGNVATVTEGDYSDQEGAIAQSFTTTYSYDALDRPIMKVDNVGNVEQAYYDSRNNRVIEMDARTNETTHYYDGVNRPIEVAREMYGGGEIVTSQTWDDNSRLVSEIDGNGNTTRYAYDSLNRLIVTRMADGSLQQIGSGAVWPPTNSQPTLGGFVSGYDAHDNPLVSVDCNGTVVTASYDLLNRPDTNNISPASGVLGATSETYQYDGCSRVVSAQNQASAVTRDYDSLGDVIQEVQQPSGASAETNTATYDAMRNQTRINYPSGRVITHTYDSLDRPTHVTDITGTAVGIVTNYYIGRSHLQERDFGNLTATYYSYDGNFNSPGDFGVRCLTALSTQSLTTFEDLDARGYSWDGNENRTLFQDFMAGNETSFEYDAINRLTNSTSKTHTNVYALDDVGNRITVISNGIIGSYSCSSNDCLLNQYTTTPVGSCASDHDGNLIKDLSGSQSNFYDHNNQLAESVTTGNTTTYSYDCFGRRVSKNAGGLVTRYYYNDWQEIQEQGPSISLSTYVWGGAVDDLLEITRNGSAYYVHTDDLGSVNKVTGSNGTVVEEYTYGDYGAPSFFNGSGTPITGSSIGNPYLFAGRRFDSETSWYYDRARYLDTEAGRFTTRDPLGPWADPLSLGNSFAYCGNDPLSYTDPMGLQGGGTKGSGIINVTPPVPLPASAWGPNGGYSLAPGTFARTYQGRSGSVGNIVAFAQMWSYQSHSGQVGNVVFFGAPPFIPGARPGQYGGVVYLCGIRPVKTPGHSGQVGAVTYFRFTPGISAALQALCLANSGPGPKQCQLCPSFMVDAGCCCLCLQSDPADCLPLWLPYFSLPPCAPLINPTDPCNQGL